MHEAVPAHPKLTVLEAALLDMSDDVLVEQVRDCQAVVCCLGHTMTFNGIFGHPRSLVADSVRRLCNAIETAAPTIKTKFVLMSTNGANNPDGSDPTRSVADRLVIGLVRLLLPPHRDNEAAAAHLSDVIGTKNKFIEWSAVRPGDLIDDDVSPYDLTPSSPVSAIFAGAKATRSNVAHAMCELITNEELWARWKGRFPVILNTVPVPPPANT
jgi:hypothetical protein